MNLRSKEAFDKWWKELGERNSGPLTNPTSLRRGFEAGFETPRVLDAFVVLENVFLRPAMFFGRVSITDFWHYYHGMIHLTDDRFGARVAKMENCLLGENGFFEWICKERGWARNVVPAHHYLTLAKEKLAETGCVPAMGVAKVEETAFELFHEDIKRFKQKVVNGDA